MDSLNASRSADNVIWDWPPTTIDDENGIESAGERDGMALGRNDIHQL